MTRAEVLIASDQVPASLPNNEMRTFSRVWTLEGDERFEVRWPKNGWTMRVESIVVSYTSVIIDKRVQLETKVYLYGHHRRTDRKRFVPYRSCWDHLHVTDLPMVYQEEIDRLLRPVVGAVTS